MPKGRRTGEKYKVEHQENKSEPAVKRARPAKANKKSTETHHKPHLYTQSSFYARADHTSKLDDGTKLKTSYKLDKEHALLSPIVRNKVKAKLPSSYRPFNEVEYSPNSNRPRAVFTPEGKTKLTHVGINGSLHLFSNKPSISRQLNFNEPESKQEDFEQSKQFRRIKKWMLDTKHTSSQITAKTLKQATEEKKRNNNRRLTSQPKAMTKKGQPYYQSRAEDYTNAAFVIEEEFTNIKWEWTHLVANFILGEAAQKAHNLVSATNHCNTAMILPESQIKKLSKVYPNGFTLKVISKQINQTHVSREITMEIITPDFTVKHTFNGLETQQPHKDYKHYFDAFYDQLIQESEQAEANKENTINKPKR